jgi:hypothetical protein
MVSVSAKKVKQKTSCLCTFKVCYGRGKDIRKQKKWYRIKNCFGRGKICKVVDKKRMAVEEGTTVRK